MKYCSRCLQTDTRPNIKFIGKLCPACYYNDKEKLSNFNKRRKVLLNIVDKYKKKDSHYDCIIGVSGGKDSTRQALYIRDSLGLNPLLVCLGYPPEQVTEVGSNNLSNLINLGFDVHVITLAPVLWKKLLKHCFLKYLNVLKSSEQAIVSSVPQLAIKYKIPLIIWGENPGWQLGDMKTTNFQKGYDGNKLRHMNTVQGGDIRWLIKSGFDPKKLSPYSYPTEKELKENNINIIYLGWFWDDWSVINNGAYSVLNGLEQRKDSPKNTSDLWNVFSLDEDWLMFNQMMKYYKFGFGRASDYCNEAIRNGTISRNKAIKVVERYDGLCHSKYIDDFCNYIQISNKKFWETIVKCTNKNLFDISKKDNHGRFIRKFEVGLGLNH